MPRAAAITRRSANPGGITAVGIDVGGERKGFHAVALTAGEYLSHLSTRNVKELSQWCCETVRARVIAVDAPCCWTMDGRSRAAELALMQKGIWCFSTSTREKALCHRTNHFGWMLRSEELFRALGDEFPLCRELPAAVRKYCFETFPHAITWHLRGGNAAASQKRKQRRELLAAAGIDLTQLTNIDLVDAALCALAAYLAAMGRECESFGEPNTGLIIVPKGPSQSLKELQEAQAQFEEPAEQAPA
jgi:predicted nuclease with RNAse H fold